MRRRASMWTFFVLSFFAVAAAVTVLPACTGDGSQGTGDGKSSPA